MSRITDYHLPAEEVPCPQSKFMRVIWDLPEDAIYEVHAYENPVKFDKAIPSSFSQTDRDEHMVHVLSKTKHKTKKINLLNFLSITTFRLQKLILESDLTHHPNLNLFANTHHTFFEIVPSNFNGLNKPKNVHTCHAETVHIGDDANLRAHRRHVMLALPVEKPSDKLYAFLYRLYVHELAHTLANHVRYRPDDHNADFIYCENLLKPLLNVISFEENLRNIIDY
uniref:Uncharacterized protein n=1 Tax=viral metagenome TaxID=1070528 RepID=A0A6C0CS70_9ZZZZ